MSIASSTVAGTTTTFAALIKTIYPSDEVLNLATRNRTFLSRVKKRDDLYGDSLAVPVFYGNPQGRSATFASAQASVTASKSKRFAITRATDYVFMTLSSELIKSTANDRASFVRAMRAEIDMGLDQLGHSASVALYGSGSGSIGRIAAGGVSGDVITLEDPYDTKNFFEGQTISGNNTDDGVTVYAGTTTVESVQHSAGTVTLVDATLINTGTGAAATDYLFSLGDEGLKMKGLAAWLPLTAPSSTSFFGVDRSVDTERLGGVRLDDTASSIEENILTVSERCVRNGGKPSEAYISHSNFSTLVKGLGSKVTYNDPRSGTKAGVGFRGVELYTSAGTVTVYPDPDCPSNRGYVLDMDTWCLHHMGDFPHLVQDDGRETLRLIDADGIEIRGRYWGNLACRAPGWSGVFSI